MRPLPTRLGAGEVGDLPKAIGRPTTRALANVGITTLDQVAGLSDTELNALHGVGPKAVRILRETLGSL
ncbi:DNA-binding protein [Nonomuraea ferruginea]